jgi:hypothetical protein
MGCRHVKTVPDGMALAAGFTPGALGREVHILNGTGQAVEVALTVSEGVLVFSLLPAPEPGLNGHAAHAACDVCGDEDVADEDEAVEAMEAELAADCDAHEEAAVKAVDRLCLAAKAWVEDWKGRSRDVTWGPRSIALLEAVAVYEALTGGDE